MNETIEASVAEEAKGIPQILERLGSEAGADSEEFRGEVLSASRRADEAVEGASRQIEFHEAAVGESIKHITELVNQSHLSTVRRIEEHENLVAKAIEEQQVMLRKIQRETAAVTAAASSQPPPRPGSP